MLQPLERAEYHEENITALLVALREGNSRNTSCKLAKLNRSTFYRWMQVSPDFRTAVHLAEAEAERGLVSVIVRAALDQLDWRAAEVLLSRRNRADWGRKDELNLNLFDAKSLTDQQLLALEARVAEGEGETGPESDGDDV